MSTGQFYLFNWIWIGIAIIMLPVLLNVTAPYGRYSRKDWGPMIPNRLGWILMELPSLITFSLFFLLGPNRISFPTLIFFLLYAIHYSHRSIIFPLRTRTARKLMPLLIALLAICFNLINGFLNGYYFGTVSGGYPIEWLYEKEINPETGFDSLIALINLLEDRPEPWPENLEAHVNVERFLDYILELFRR